MKLTIQKQITECQELEIDLPSYYSKFGVYKMLAVDGSIMTALPTGVFVSPPDGARYDKEVAETIAMDLSTKEEFDAMVSSALETMGRVLDKQIEIHACQTEPSY